jgi:hypothetical protein
MFYGDTKLRKCTMTYMSLWCVWPNHVSKDHEQTKCFLCQCSIRHLMWRCMYILLLAVTQNCYKSTTTQYIYSVDSDIYLSNTHTECIVASPLNNGYENVTQWYILCTMPILQYYTSIFVYICQVFSSVQDYQPNFKKEHAAYKLTESRK